MILVPALITTIVEGGVRHYQIFIKSPHAPTHKYLQGTRENAILFRRIGIVAISQGRTVAKHAMAAWSRGLVERERLGKTDT